LLFYHPKSDYVILLLIVYGDGPIRSISVCTQASSTFAAVNAFYLALVHYRDPTHAIFRDANYRLATESSTSTRKYFLWFHMTSPRSALGTGTRREFTFNQELDLQLGDAVTCEACINLRVPVAKRSTKDSFVRRH